MSKAVYVSLEYNLLHMPLPNQAKPIEVDAVRYALLLSPFTEVL